MKRNYFEAILYFLEPADVYQQALLPKRERSFRMRLSDAFYKLFKKQIDK
jgi:hypothetical protein